MKLKLICLGMGSSKLEGAHAKILGPATLKLEQIIDCRQQNCQLRIPAHNF